MGPLRRSPRALLAVCALLLAVLAGSSGWAAAAEPARLLIVHTNDLHDHVRPGEQGIGGLPWVAGHIARVRAERDDVLVLDAGDAAEKGDLVAFLTGSRLTFEAMGRIGYDAIAVGNHEHNFGLDALREFDRLSGGRMLAVNLLAEDGELLFPASRVVETARLRIGVVGVALPRDRDTLDFEASGRALAAEAQWLLDEQSVDLVVATVHVGLADAARWSELAPQVQVFVTGHSHEVTAEPVRVEATGALLVQAGANARMVGHLELELDREHGVVAWHGHPVLMDHDTLQPDTGMLAWLKAVESELAPQAGEVLMTLDQPLGWYAIARIGAEAIRVYGEAEVGLFHPTHVVRNPLLPGPVTVNALFRTSADRGHPLVRTELSGAEIEAYLQGLARRDPRAWGQTQWAGFQVAWAATEGDGQALPRVSLDPQRRYSVVMPEREWEKRFLRLVGRLDAQEREGPLGARRFAAEPAAFSKTDALSAWLRSPAAEDLPLALETLAVRQGDADPLEPLAERLFLARTQALGATAYPTGQLESRDDDS